MSDRLWPHPVTQLPRGEFDPKRSSSNVRLAGAWKEGSLQLIN